MNDRTRQVYFSYKWGGESERIVNELEAALKLKGITSVRDKAALGYKGKIGDFMREIGRGNAIVVVICNKYLTSDNTMFELVEIAKNKDVHERIFPVILQDADIYKPVNRIKYIKHWEDKKKELNEAMRTVDLANLQGITEEMNNYDTIRDHISGLTFLLKDMNALTPEMHENTNFLSLIGALEETLNAAPVGAAQQTASVSIVPSATVDLQFQRFAPTWLGNRPIAIAALVSLLGVVAAAWIYIAAGGRFARVEEVGSQTTESADSDQFSKSATRGNDLFDQNRFADAVVAYTEALRINPESHVAYLNRGSSYLHQRQYPQALEDLTDAVRLNPQHVESHVLRGLALLGAGRRPEALDEFRKATALDPIGPLGTCSLAAALWLERKAPAPGKSIGVCSNDSFRQLLAEVTGGESP